MHSVPDYFVEKIGGFVVDDLHPRWRFSVAVRILRLEVLVHVNPGILVRTSNYGIEISIPADQSERVLIIFARI